VAIKWSAVAVNEAMDKVECQINLAESFLAEAKAKAVEARQIANLPQYVMQRLGTLISQIERMDAVKSAIESVRDSIPEGAADDEQHKGKHGSQQSIM